MGVERNQRNEDNNNKDHTKDSVRIRHSGGSILVSRLEDMACNVSNDVGEQHRTCFHRREQMKYILEEHYGESVWTNKPMDEARHDNCMCWSCSSIKPGQPDNCQYAQALYKVCQEGGIATMVTRCREWKPREE
jgi:hypothetical protein